MLRRWDRRARHPLHRYRGTGLRPGPLGRTQGDLMAEIHGRLPDGTPHPGSRGLSAALRRGRARSAGPADAAPGDLSDSRLGLPPVRPYPPPADGAMHPESCTVPSDPPPQHGVTSKSG